MKANKTMICLLGLALAALLSTGCATKPSGPDDAWRASRDTQRAVAAWTEDHDYHRAVAGLEDALDDFGGDSFTQSTLTALALVHLEYGNRDAFLETAGRLKSEIGNREYVDRHTQHVLLVARAMDPVAFAQLPGRGFDSAHGRSVNTLLGAE